MPQATGTPTQVGATQAPKVVKSRKGLMMFLGGLAVVILVGVTVTTGLVKFGYLTPDPARCNEELLYHILQNREPVPAKTFTLPFSEVKRAWLWANGAPIGQDPTPMWLGACKGIPAPRNENIRVSFDGIGLLLLIWIVSTISFGFNKRRTIALAVLLLVGMPLIPHWTTSRLGDWAAWIRYAVFWLLGLVYFLISWKLLNKQPSKPAAGQVVTVSPVVVQPK